MNEMRALLAAQSRAEAQALKTVLATVIRVTGSSYRRPGAKMLIAENGEIAGAVSGGCLERDLIARALRMMGTESVERIVYDTRIDRPDEDDDMEVVTQVSLGCEGVIEILVDPQPQAWLAAMNQVIETGQSSVFVRSFEGDSFQDMLPAPTRLVIFGAGLDAIEITRMAQLLGWHTTVIDVRSGFPQPRGHFVHVDRFVVGSSERASEHVDASKRPIVMLMTHNFDHDKRIVTTLLGEKLPFLGILGPRTRGERLIEELSNELGLDAVGLRTRLRFPLGLDLGGEGAAAIALSALAEAHAVIHKRDARFLRDRGAPIHERKLGESFLTWGEQNRGT